MEREESVLGCTAWVKRRLNGPWSAATVGHLLTPRTLDLLVECFSSLDSVLKTRVLLGVLSLRCVRACVHVCVCVCVCGVCLCVCVCACV
jgi:hypothetical protein